METLPLQRSVLSFLRKVLYKLDPLNLFDSLKKNSSLNFYPLLIAFKRFPQRNSSRWTTRTVFIPGRSRLDQEGATKLYDRDFKEQVTVDDSVMLILYKKAQFDHIKSPLSLRLSELYIVTT